MKKKILSVGPQSRKAERNSRKPRKRVYFLEKQERKRNLVFLRYRGDRNIVQNSRKKYHKMGGTILLNYDDVQRHT